MGVKGSLAKDQTFYGIFFKPSINTKTYILVQSWKIDSPFSVQIVVLLKNLYKLTRTQIKESKLYTHRNPSLLIPEDCLPPIVAKCQISQTKIFKRVLVMNKCEVAILPMRASLSTGSYTKSYCINLTKNGLFLPIYISQLRHQLICSLSGAR